MDFVKFLIILDDPKVSMRFIILIYLWKTTVLFGNIKAHDTST